VFAGSPGHSPVGLIASVEFLQYVLVSSGAGVFLGKILGKKHTVSYTFVEKMYYSS